MLPAIIMSFNKIKPPLDCRKDVSVCIYLVRSVDYFPEVRSLRFSPFTVHRSKWRIPISPTRSDVAPSYFTFAGETALDLSPGKLFKRMTTVPRC